MMMLLNTLPNQTSSVFTSSVEALERFLIFFKEACWENQMSCTTCASDGYALFSLQVLLEGGTRLSGDALGDNLWNAEAVVFELNRWMTSLKSGQWIFETPLLPIEDIWYSEFCPSCLSIAN